MDIFWFQNLILEPWEHATDAYIIGPKKFKQHAYRTKSEA